MKNIIAFSLVYAYLAKSAVGVECSATMEVPIDVAAMKLYFTGFKPTVTRFTNYGLGNKIVLKGYEVMPMVASEVGSMTVSAGEACDGAAPNPTSTSSAARFLGFALPFLLGTTSGGVGSGIALGLAGGMLGQAMVDAQTTQECELAPIAVDIYIDASSDEIVMRAAQSGDFEMCPPESLYWKHHPLIYGGYEGCVGEKAYYPCGQDSQGLEDPDLISTKPLIWNNESCVSTGYTVENRTFWVVWGDPLDKHELNARTGFNPVVSFPYTRGPYPSYQFDKPAVIAEDDSADARVMAKELLVFLEMFTEDALTEFEVAMTEGAESGIYALYASKALEIARTTCTRDIYIFSEVPSYGYENGDASWLANKFASTFLNSTDCPCFNTSSCREPTVTLTTVGWLPGTPLPVATGFDGVEYAADSDSPNSPWFETLVIPENPSGKIKTPRLPNPNRRICDGVYVWPMYFGMKGYRVPTEEIPDCSGWAFAITKAYSASVRAGFLMHKTEPSDFADAITTIMNDIHSGSNGIYSEWSWYGQMQLWDLIMTRPIDDPTSWLGAYSEIMDEKWTAVIEGFDGCPVITVTNPKGGAYVFFRINEAYVGIQKDTDFYGSFMKDVLGVSAPTYSWGFRGADPADFYGANYTINDFTRMHLYRDVTVYEEISRRAKIVCADMDATVGSFISINQWAASAATNERRLAQGYLDMNDRKRHLREVIPDLTDAQLDYLAASHEDSDKVGRAAASCAPSYSTSCLFKKIGTRFSDQYN